MRKTFILCFVVTVGLAQAQHVNRAYDRDTHDQFNLKSVSSESVVRGPIVTQQSIFDFANPYKKLTEASVWFDLDEAAILSGFGYWYKDEFVPGILMDKNKAWFIYTAITSRNEDPGIMVQTTPNSYHTQIFPLAVGYDFRVKLDTVGFLQPDNGKLTVSLPSFNETIYDTTVKSAQPGTLRVEPASADASATKAQPSKTYVEYPTDPGLDMQVYAQKHKDGYTYVAGMLRTDKPNANVTISGIHKVYWTRPNQSSADGTVKLFIGRRKGPGVVRVVSKDRASREKYVKAKTIKANERGEDAAKLWAHQKLMQDQWRHSSDVLRFSLFYQIPSTETALLAVPKEQLALFKKKAAEYRRHAAEEARKERAWQNQRQQNWNRSSGGDPEIRVYLPDAAKVYAELPDGRSFDLIKAKDGYWGGNYDIPADAPEGTYQIKVIATDATGNKTEQTLNYFVDRTPPTGTLKVENGFLMLASNKPLARAIVVYGDGTEETMLEVTPGVYKLPLDERRVVKVVLFDKAHNVSEVAWSG